MKTRNILITLGVTTLAVITLNINASGALLSPRATSNEIIHVAGTNGDPNLIALGLTSAEYATPREAGNKSVVIVGTNKEVNPATLCSRNMTASPKAIQACAANPSGPMPCCVVATTK
jgi:hypothetical protein